MSGDAKLTRRRSLLGLAGAAIAWKLGEPDDGSAAVSKGLVQCVLTPELTVGPHVHVKVHVGGNVVHTGQLFFPAAITTAVYAKAPYRSHGRTPDTSNAADAIFRNGGNRGMLTLAKHGAGYTASISMGVSV